MLFATINLQKQKYYKFNNYTYNNNVFLYKNLYKKLSSKLSISSKSKSKTNNLSKTSSLLFRSLILSNYWRILSYFNQFRRNNSFKVKKFVRPSIVKKTNTYSTRLNYLYSFRVYRLFILQKKEKLA